MRRDANISVRKTVDITSDLEREVQSIADEKKWSFSYTSYVLLQQAVKEKNRKKKHPIQNPA
jgi:hypothetical protein